MTKKDLIEILENCPDDAEIYIWMDGIIQDDNTWGAFLRDPSPSIQMVDDYRIAVRSCKETANAKKSIVL